MTGSSRISAIVLTSKTDLEEENDFVYRHRASARLNSGAKFSMPQWILSNLITITGNSN